MDWRCYHWGVGFFNQICQFLNTVLQIQNPLPRLLKADAFFPHAPERSVVIQGIAKKLPIMPPMLDRKKTKMILVTRFL